MAQIITVKRKDARQIAWRLMIQDEKGVPAADFAYLQAIKMIRYFDVETAAVSVNLDWSDDPAAEAALLDAMTGL
jgi:hypothetical protein